MPISYAASGYFMKRALHANTSGTRLLFVTNHISGCLFSLTAIGRNGVMANMQRDTFLFLLGLAVSIAAMALTFNLARKISPFP